MQYIIGNDLKFQRQRTGETFRRSALKVAGKTAQKSKISPVCYGYGGDHRRLVLHPRR